MASGDSVDEIQVIDTFSKMKTEGNAEYKDEDSFRGGKTFSLLVLFHESCLTEAWGTPTYFHLLF